MQISNGDDQANTQDKTNIPISSRYDVECLLPVCKHDPLHCRGRIPRLGVRTCGTHDILRFPGLARTTRAARLCSDELPYVHFGDCLPDRITVVCVAPHNPEQARASDLDLVVVAQDEASQNLWFMVWGLGFGV